MSNPDLDTSMPRLPATHDIPPLLALLATRGAMTGPELARELGISRAAVWKQVEGLRAAGLDVDSGASGYRLRQSLEPLDAESLRAGLPAAVEQRVGAIENHWRLDSTSSELARRAADLPDLAFVFADWQLQGRGRRGRQWLSPPAANVQFSCLKRFATGFAGLSGLSLVAGLAAVRALHDCGVRRVGLKWPNDLVHDDAKLGGILVELGGEFLGPCHAIIGVGINLHVPESVRAALDRPCTDVAGLCGGAAPSRQALAQTLVARLVEMLDAFDRTGFAGFGKLWTKHDALAGRRIRAEGAHGVFEGVAEGVDARGALQVRTRSGLRSVDSAEVTVRPA